MKKLQILLPLTAVLLTLIGCKKDNEKSGPSGDTVTLSATLGGGEKTEIDDNLLMKWSVGDKVTINGKEYDAQFPLGNYETATFAGVESAGRYEAYYPASLHQGGDTYELPSTQYYSVGHSNVLSRVNPMYAVTDTRVLHFHNICALAKLQVRGEGTVQRIVVTAEKPLCGEFTVKQDEDDGHYYAKVDGSGSTTLTLDCGAGVSLGSTPMTFYIALPEGSLGNIKFTFRSVGGHEWHTDPAPSTLTAGVLYAVSVSAVVTDKPGALAGKFSVASGKQVYFSKGNLQYQASTNTWQFAGEQYSYIGGPNSSASSTYDGWIDLFGWGTSNNAPSGDPYYEHYQPWSTSTVAAVEGDPGYGTNRYHYGPSTNVNPNYLTGASDWGYNAISNGGNDESFGWRTLTSSEWEYLFNTRPTDYGSDNRYAEVKVDGKAGILLFPDNFSSWPAGAGTDNEPTTFNTSSSNWNNVNYTVEEFNVLQTAGCVFLPAAGRRSGISVNDAGSSGRYWSSMPNGATNAYSLGFASGSVNPANHYSRYLGFSVRLVLPVEN